MASSIIALSAIFSSAAARSPIAGRDHVGLAARRLCEAAAGDLARLHEPDAAGDVGDRASDVVEHAQARVRGPERRGLSRAGGEAAVGILLGRGVGGGLGEIGRRLGSGRTSDRRQNHQGRPGQTRPRRLMLLILPAFGRLSSARMAVRSESVSATQSARQCPAEQRPS